MAQKKAILALGRNLSLAGDGENLKKFLKKAVVVKNYEGGEIGELPESSPVAPEGLAEAMAGGAGLAVVDLGSPDAAQLDAALGRILAAADRSTLTVLAGGSALAFYGLAVDPKKGSIDRPAKPADVAATLAYIADLPLAEDCQGAVLYQVMKDVNWKLNEIRKLGEAIGRMEAALQRDNREPWDKHDCA